MSRVLLLALIILIVIGLFIFDIPKLDELITNIVLIKGQFLGSVGSQELILQIGDEKITREELEVYRAFDVDKDEEAILDSIIKSALLRMIAREYNIEVGEEEVKAYIDWVRRGYEANFEAKKSLMAYISGDEEEFWNSYATYRVYYDFLLVSKLKKLDLDLDNLVRLKVNEVEVKYFKSN